MAKKKGDDGRFCTFCGKGRAEVQNMISGPGEICICEECVEVCNDIIAEEVEKDEPAPGSSPVPKPYEIKCTLDEYVGSCFLHPCGP